MFGGLVGGLDTLSVIERVEVDNKDRPIEDIVITSAHVFVDPFAEADQEVSPARDAAAAAAGYGAVYAGRLAVASAAQFSQRCPLLLGRVRSPAEFVCLSVSVRVCLCPSV